MGNVHEVAQQAAPDARVAYVDYDPVVTSHARAMLSSPNVLVMEGDLRLPEMILGDPDLRNHIDLSQPVALLLVAVLHFIADADDPYRLVRELAGQLAPGSYVAVTHATPDDVPAEVAKTMTRVYDDASAQVTARSFKEVKRFFDGLEFIEPGLVDVKSWRAGPGSSQGQSLIYGGVAVKR
jgi:trans-aconitate methyltransferase